MFNVEELPLSGLLLVRPPRHSDNRGHLTKIFHKPAFEALGLVETFDECYYSVSGLNILRGLHFQTPPFDHEKCVTCIAGHAQDVVLDLRVRSATYGQHLVIPLSSEEPAVVYIPRGMAHGFLSLAKSTILLYSVTSVYQPNADEGILWNSAGIKWAAATPILSKRDSAFPTLADFKSPF